MRDNTLTHSRARKLRHNQTDAERRLWHHLRRRNLSGHRFRRQVPIGPFIADFACLDPKLVVEIDGSQHDQQAGYDAARSVFLEAQGFAVLRFYSNETLSRTDAVLEVIWKKLEELERLRLIGRRQQN